MAWTSNRISSNNTGKLCEAIAVASFIGEGYLVAIPFGNQGGWDILISKNNGVSWLRVQVKSVIKKDDGSITVRLIKEIGRKRLRSNYTENDTDLVVAVLPEMGKLWVLQPIQFSGHSEVRLENGDGKVNLTRDLSELANIVKADRGSYCSKYRGECRKMDNTVRPDNISDSSWETYLGFIGGAKISDLGAKLTISDSSVRDRISRVAEKVKVLEVKRKYDL